MQVRPGSVSQCHKFVHPLMVLHWTDHSWNLSSPFFSTSFSDAFIVIFHVVNLLCCVIKLDVFGALVAAGAGFLVFKWSLPDVLFGLVLKHFVRKFVAAHLFQTLKMDI